MQKKSVRKKKAVGPMPTLLMGFTRLREIFRQMGDELDRLEDFDNFTDGEDYGLAECCAFHSIQGFIDYGQDKSKVSERVWRAFLCRDILDIFNTDVVPYGPIHVVATTTPTQEAHTMLPKLGFKAISKVINPNTNNEVTLWQVSIPR